MRKQIRKVIAHLLIWAICMGSMELPASAAENISVAEEYDVISAWDGSSMEKVYENDDYKITFTLSSTWDTGYNANIKIDNLGKTPIQNWRIQFALHNTIDNIWNAEIASSQDNEYVIKNVGWNQDITVGGSVEFGFSGNQSFYGFPESYEMIQSSAPVQESDYGIEYIVDGDWGSGFYGSINITNTADTNLEEWVLEFDFDRKITEIWNGVIESHEGNHYVVRNAEYNSIVAPDETVSIGIKGSGGSSEDVPYNYNLYGYGEVGQGDVSEGDVPGGSTDGEDVTSGDVTDGDVTDGDITAGDAGMMQNYTRDWSEMRDTDRDGLPDEYESHIGTDIHNPDTDGDELTDGYEELYSCTDPLDQYTVDENIMDSELDPDEDGLTMLEEAGLETDPLNPDSDEDGLIDGEEVDIYGTKPAEWDTDKDTISDGDEVKVGLDPLRPRTYGYPDAEYQYEAEIAEDSEILEKINADNTDYQMSLEIKGQGSVISELIVRESAYEDSIVSDAVLGRVVEVMHRGEGTIEDVTIKFKVDTSKIDELNSIEELQGINRYNIFMYYESENILIPIRTSGDEATNTISATVDCVGTFCAVDMEKWLDNIGYQEEEADDEELDNSTDITYAFSDNKSKKRVDITFCVVNDARTLTKEELPEIKKRILSTSKRIFDKYEDVRVSLYDMSGNQIAYKVDEYMNQYYGTNIEQVESMLEKLIFRNTTNLLDKEFRYMRINPFRPEACKAVVFIGKGYYYTDTMERYIQIANEREIHTFFAQPDVGINSLYRKIVNSTSGLVIESYFDFEDAVVGYIDACDEEDVNYEYNIISATGIKRVKLDAKLRSDAITDTDGDGLTDWQEVKVEQLIFDDRGKMALPSYYEYIQTYIGEHEWLSNWAAKYYDIKDFEGKSIEELLDGIYVLPISSDPTMADSDGDNILDCDESKWDGVDERYRNVGPLHKDTIETLFPEIANEGTDKIWDPAYITVKDNDVVMNMRVVFLDGADEEVLKYTKRTGLHWRNQKACDNIVSRVGEDVTFKELFVDALNERWAGVYEGSEYDFYKGMKVNFSVNVIEEDKWISSKRVVEVNFYPGTCGVPNATGDWNKSKNKIVKMYTGWCDDESHELKAGSACSKYMDSKRDVAEFSGVCAHETGHVMGLADMYANASINKGYEPVSNKEIPYVDNIYGLEEGYGIMKKNGIAVPNDIEMILLAFASGEEQFYVPQGETQRMSLAIKSEVEFHRPSIPNAVYEWNEFEKRMKLK